MRFLVLLFGVSGHLGVLLEELEGLGVVSVGVQIQPQLGDDEQKRLKLGGAVCGQGGGVHFQLEGEVQAGEHGAVGQCVGLVIFLAALLLKGYIWHRQGRAGGHGAAGVAAEAGSGSVIRIQGNPSFDQSVTA